MATTNPLLHINDADLLKTAGYIGGQWQTSSNCFSVTDPATGHVIAQVSDLAASDTQHAIDTAQQALAAWSALSVKKRSAILYKWFELLQMHANDLARIMTAEQGKPQVEALGEVAYAASFVQWYAEEAKRIEGEVLPSFNTSRRQMVLRQPIGVCAAITPWNFPLSMITRKVAPALAAGCTVVVKPSELTPLSALAAAELAHRAGIPAGVFNVVPSTHSSEVGKVLCSSKVVRHLSFTGSTEVGRILMAQCAPTLKKISLELGGNAPFIVFDDADLDSAVRGAMQSKFRNAGQTCVCANRFYVQAGIYDSFVERFAQSMRTLQVGNGFDDNTTQGPLINAASVQKMQAHVVDAIAHGGRIAIGGQALKGQFFAPTLIAEANHNMLCAHEETFGPLAPVFRFDTEAQVIAQANATPYGLASYFYSRDIGRITRVSEALEYGMVGVNVGQFGSENTPFGGIKQSGLGREGSRHGLQEYLEMKLVVLGDVA